MKNNPPKEKYKGEAQAKALRKYFADVQKEYDRYGGKPLAYIFEKGDTITKMVDQVLTAPPKIKEMYVNELKSDYSELLPLFKQRDKARKEMGLDSIKKSDKLEHRAYVRSDPIGKIKVQRDYGKTFKDTINKATEGLKDGGTTMKNNPPVGSLPEEVADDIPAMISEGEFVIPADVVRYVGLDKIRAMMHEAKMGLQCMEDEGLIVDVDEEGRPEEPQKEPKGEVAILDVVQIEKAEPMTKSLKEGGIVSPILNPEEEVNVMNKGGMIAQETGPDGTMRILGMQEGGMPMQMEQMMGEMPQEAPVSEFAEEMPPEQTEPMPEAPMMNAPVAQVINGVPHLMAYLQEDEIKALQDAGRGLDENGEQMLSPEGIPVFNGNGGSGPSEASESDAAGGVAGPDAPSMMGEENPDEGQPGDDVGGMEIEEMQKEMTKADKKELDPETDRKFVKGVGFIERYIASRNQPNPLQGKPQYAVATAAGGGLMRTPVYLQEGGSAMDDDEDNRRFEGSDEGGSIEFNPQDLSADEQNRLEAEAPSGAFDPEGLQQMGYEVDTTGSVPVVTSTEPPSEPNIASDEQVRERLPELFNSQTGEPFAIFGMEGGDRAAQILGENPDISDASLDYLRQNRDVFLDAKKRTESDEDVSYEDVAQQHFDLFGRHEDRKGMDGLMSMQGPSEIDESLRGDPIGSMVGDTAGGIMSPDTPEVEDDVSQIGKPIIAETDPELGSEDFYGLDATTQSEIEQRARRDRTRPGLEPKDDKGTYDTNPYESTYRQSPTWEWSREARLQRIDDLMEGRTTDMTDAERNRHLKEDVFKVA